MKMVEKSIYEKNATACNALSDKKIDLLERENTMIRTELKVLSRNDGVDIYTMLQSIPYDENGFINDGAGKTYEEFEEWLVRKEKNSLQEGIVDGWKVPETIYWLLIDGKPIGFGKLRHLLTDSLRKAGGNIGYAITPNYRGKGYGKLLLKLLLGESKKKGLEEVLLTIHRDNFASINVAKANGGCVEKEDNERVYIWLSTDNYRN